MKPPEKYTGVLLLDPRNPKKNSIKLSTDQKSLLKGVSRLLITRTNQLHGNLGSGSSLSIPLKTIPDEIQRTLATLIVVFGFKDSSQRTVIRLYRAYRFWAASLDGHLVEPVCEYKSRYSSSTGSGIQLVGMDNWKHVMCYMDSLLVAMFYSSSAFDYLLDKSKDANLSASLQSQVEELKVVLRFIVNLLRSGEHIPSGVIEQLCMVLHSLGCELALSGAQEDSLQLYEFLAESLSLPLLTMKLDIIHSGKVNLNDDLRLIQERTVLISVPTNEDDDDDKKQVKKSDNDNNDDDDNNNSNNDSHNKNPGNFSNEPPVTLEECLNNYFNNSVTVRRHLDEKRVRRKSKDLPALSTEEISEYEKVGILRGPSSPKPVKKAIAYALDSANHSFNSTNQTPIIERMSSSSSPAEEAICDVQSSASDPKPLVLSESKPESNSVLSDISSAVSSGNSATLSIKSTPAPATDRISQVGSISKVSERIEASRTRSSTIVSVLNKVPNGSHMTRRASSISNTEVTLPAWMFLQLLPYYTNPSINLQFENHEMLYRSRNTRSRTIDSTDSSAPKTLPQNTSHEETMTAWFESRFANKRPVVPICLKRYVWDSKGKSHKVSRKVIIPEVMKTPYFIAEDRTKPGFVDFRRNFDNKAPCGSFMLVLDSCVCHRGDSVNSGHYVALTRKKPFNPYKDTPDPSAKQWLLFNDLFPQGQKVKEVSYNEAMEKEDPYILFYRVVELHELDEPVESESVNSLLLPPRQRDRYLSNVTALSKTTTVGSTYTESDDPTLTSRKQSSVTRIDPTTSASVSSVSSSSGSVSEDKKKVKPPKRPFDSVKDILPSEPFYIGVDDMYYWYTLDQNGSYRLADKANTRVVPLTVDQISDILGREEDADAGFIDKLNTTLLAIRRGPSASSSLVNFKHHGFGHHHHLLSHNHKKQLEEESSSDDVESDVELPKPAIPKLDTFSLSNQSKPGSGSASPAMSSSLLNCSVDPLAEEPKDIFSGGFSQSEPASRLVSPTLSTGTISRIDSAISSGQGKVLSETTSIAQTSTLESESSKKSKKKKHKNKLKSMIKKMLS